MELDCSSAVAEVRLVIVEFDWSSVVYWCEVSRAGQ